MAQQSDTEAARGQEPRLKRRYATEVVPALMERFGRRNRLAVPALQKIVVNIGVGEAAADANAMNDAVQILRAVTGQQPVITRARRSVAGFRLRQGQAIGCKVTLRGRRMYEFLDRLISVVLPRVRDFRGLSTGGFDGHGNYSLGLADASVYPELDLDELKNLFGMDITIVTSARNDQEGFELLSLLGMPFRQ